MSTTDPWIGLQEGFVAGDSWVAAFNSNALRTSALLMLGVKSKSLDVGSISGAPAEGDRYIVPGSATGAWAGQDHNVAYYLNAQWNFIVAKDGFISRVHDEATFAGFDGSAWTNFAAITSGSGFADAPNDGKRYIRKSEGWDNEANFGQQVNDYTAWGSLVQADINAYARFNVAADGNINVQANATVANVVGASIVIRNVGTGLGSITSDAGVTINVRAGSTAKAAAQGAVLMLTCVAVDEWDLTGDVTT